MRISSVGRGARVDFRAACAGMMLATLVMTPATADDFGTYTGGTGPLADGSQHLYCWGNGFDVALRDNAQAAMVNLDSQTDMLDTFQNPCNVVTTDVVWLDGDLEAGVRGGTRCVFFVTQNPPVCDSADVILDPAELNVGANDEQDTTKTACHEVGHTVGLTHSQTGDDCMRSGELPNLNAQWQKYNAHHVSHISSAY